MRSSLGRMEHRGGETAGVSCYGTGYNWLWFNDGYHVEHHQGPGTHWTRLPAVRVNAKTSARPPRVLST